MITCHNLDSVLWFAGAFLHLIQCSPSPHEVEWRTYFPYLRRKEADIKRDRMACPAW